MRPASLVLERPVELNFEGNEYRPLLGGDLSSSVPWSEDQRWWVRLPAQNVLALRTILRKLDYTWALLIFWPLALLSNAQNWGIKSVFALNFLALLTLETRFISTAEWLWLFSGSTVTNLLTEVLPNIFPLLIGITGILYSEIQLVESFIVGSLIANLLVGTGLSFVIGGIWNNEQRIDYGGVRNVAVLTLLTAFPYIVPTFLGAFMRDELHFDDLRTLITVEAGVLLAFYIMWLCFRYKTHAFLFQGRGELYASPVVDDGLSSSNSGTDLLGEERIQLPSRLWHLLWLIIIFAVAVQCSANLIHSIPELVKVTPLSQLSIGAVLLPVITSLSNCFKTCLIAKTNRMELVIHLTVETTLAMVFLNLPGLTFANMILGHGPLLNLNFILNISLFISVFTTAYLIRDGIFHILKGCMALALYLIIIMGLFVYPNDWD
ncbi:hypothetical protein BDV26DRAFT_267713 [Aspergillus bertholletiae]|uniref:Sodium/calcium exchanger membrane region domain-containing protein n=1 Tax=Aspergillus bertholletiae TaxID=1226010 RepID=A0A5N7B347_9EURO|nr:hypothetical protein BDV26DRAFT_267713 [Aspergillus bertholletiae]